MAPTQAALYDELAGDLHLSWSEAELPERERTKHVHRLHPYLGKFVPQLVEALLERYVRPGGRVLDPFAGSGTTLVQCLESGYDAVGVDIAAFNCLLMRVKTAEYDLFRARDRAPRRARARRALRVRGRAATSASGSRRARPPSSSTSARSLDDYEHADVLRVVLARAARSARLTTHFDLEFPQAPQREPYWCHKHRRTCRPCRRPTSSSRRYLLDTLERLKAFQRVRDARAHGARSSTATRRESRSRGRSTRLTSPPYPGLIDYHEQHRYAYELLGLDDRRERELGAAAAGRAGARSRRTSTASPTCSRAASAPLADGAPVLVVVNDRRDLYPEILERAGSASSTGSSGTSTAERAGARASTSSRFWSAVRET